MKDEELKKLLDNFLDKPTEENLRLVNETARTYTSEWIESGGRIRKSSARRKTTYKRIFPEVSPSHSGFYIALQDKFEDNRDPYKVISLRQREEYSSKGPIHNRRFYFQKYNQVDGKHFWFIDEEFFLDRWYGPAHSGWFNYEDHRRPKNIKIKDQYIKSADLSKEEKYMYLKDIVQKDEIANFMEQDYHTNYIKDLEYLTFFDMIDNIDFVIDMYAGDTSDDEDGSNTRKVLLCLSNLAIFTIRSLSRDSNKKNKFSRSIEGSDWIIENSMPDISPQTAIVFWDSFQGAEIKLTKKYKLDPNYDLNQLRSTLNRKRLEWLGTEGKTMKEILDSNNPYHDHPTIKNPESHLNWDIKQGRVIKD